MRDLRLIGVHDDGEHLVMADDASGEEFRLRIDEPLRAAARRDRPRLGQLQIAIDNDVRPREVQSMIRAGATADEVSARTGWDLDKVLRFEGPVLAEREHVAERAQTVRMRGSATADPSETLADRVRARFSGRGVASSSVHWDARRNEEGQWTVSAVFTAGGRERTATWWFDLAGMSVVAQNDEAKWLSEAEAPGGPLPSAVHRPTAVFDVEVEESRAERAHRADPDELIASMREHSGARGRGGRKKARTADLGPDDGLPFDAEHPPAAHGQHPDDVADVGEPADADASASIAGTDQVTRGEEADEADGATSGTESNHSTPSDQPEEQRPEQTKESQPSTPGRGRHRRGRASVPSWDDVMFGTARD